MRVLTIYAHHNPRSFCHAVLERFTAGLRDAGHESAYSLAASLSGIPPKSAKSPAAVCDSVTS